MTDKEIYEHFMTIVKNTTSGDIALTQNDIDKIMQNRKVIFFDIIRCKNTDEMLASLQQALKTDNKDKPYYTDDAQAILINFSIDSNVSMVDTLMETVDFINKSADDKADVIWTTLKKDISEDITITILVTK